MSSPSDKPAKTAVEHFDSGAQQYEKSTGGCTRELARMVLDLPELADVGHAGSVVLDNACGTGIVAEEIIRRQGGEEDDGGSTTIFLADASANMVEIARNKVEAMSASAGKSRFRIEAGVMPGESLALVDGRFTHSITNLGILFYADSAAGARELRRTLKPGGVAVVTSWVELGYLDAVVRPAQLAVRPDEQPYELPIKTVWLSPDHLQRCLREDGGFSSVDMTEKKVHFGAATVEELGDLLADTFQGGVCKDWSDEEKTRFRELVKEKTATAAEEYEMPNGQSGSGVPMIASVAVCRK